MIIQHKETPTDYDILEVIRNRWSPRAFSNENIDDHTLNKLFEAMRWAPSSMNEQPWRIIYARKGEEAHTHIGEALMPGNKPWAAEAPVLMVTIIKTHFERNGAINQAAMHDLGLAVANLSIQATAEGIGLHQIGGIDLDQVARTLSIPEGFQPVTGIAMGYFGNPDDLPENLRNRELAERKRRPVREFVFNGAFPA